MQPLLGSALVFSMLDKAPSRRHPFLMEILAIKRPLESEGIPPLIKDPDEAMEIFGEILQRGSLFYTDTDETSPLSRVTYRIVPLAES